MSARDRLMEEAKVAFCTLGNWTRATVVGKMGDKSSLEEEFQYIHIANKRKLTFGHK